MVHLKEQKVKSLSAAAVLADEYMLTDKSVFQSRVTRASSANATNGKVMPVQQKDDKECFLLLETC